MRPVLSALLLGVPWVSTAERHVGPVTDMVVSGGRVYSCSQSGVLLGSESDLERLVQPGFRVNGVGLFQRGETYGDLLLFAGGKPGEKGILGSISEKPGKDETFLSFELAEDLVYDLDVSPDSRFFAAACADGSVLFGDFEELSRGKWTVRHKHSGAARAVAFSPDGKMLASAGLDGVVMISAAGAGPGAAPRQLLDHTAGVESIAWSPDSEFVATGSRDCRVRLHRVTNSQLIRTYSGLGMENEPVAARVVSRVLALAWNKIALVAGTSKGILYRLSEVDDTRTKLDRPGTDPVYALAFGPDGALLIGGQSRLQELRIRP